MARNINEAEKDTLNQILTTVKELSSEKQERLLWISQGMLIAKELNKENEGN